MHWNLFIDGIIFRLENFIMSWNFGWLIFIPNFNSLILLYNQKNIKTIFFLFLSQKRVEKIYGFLK